MNVYVGDEFHYLFSCPFLSRRTYIGHVNCSNPSIFTFKKVMSESNLYKLKWVCYCVSVIHKTKDAYRPQNSTLQTFRHVGTHAVALRDTLTTAIYNYLPQCRSLSLEISLNFLKSITSYNQTRNLRRSS